MGGRGLVFHGGARVRNWVASQVGCCRFQRVEAVLDDMLLRQRCVRRDDAVLEDHELQTAYGDSVTNIQWCPSPDSRAVNVSAIAASEVRECGLTVSDEDRSVFARCLGAQQLNGTVGASTNRSLALSERITLGVES